MQFCIERGTPKTKTLGKYVQLSCRPTVACDTSRSTAQSATKAVIVPYLEDLHARESTQKNHRRSIFKAIAMLVTRTARMHDSRIDWKPFGHFRGCPRGACILHLLMSLAILDIYWLKTPLGRVERLAVDLDRSLREAKGLLRSNKLTHVAI